jgi:hypothetical protein
MKRKGCRLLKSNKFDLVAAFLKNRAYTGVINQINLMYAFNQFYLI